MKKKQVVAYVRVSSASEAQLYNYDFQEAYWHSASQLPLKSTFTAL